MMGQGSSMSAGELCPHTEDAFGSEQGTCSLCRDAACCRSGCRGLCVLLRLALRVPPGLAGKSYLLVFGSMAFAEQGIW